MFMDAFGPKGSAALAGITGDVTVFTTIKARGRLSGGQVVESNKFTFPITVFTSGARYTGCPPGTGPAGRCVIGQDVAKLPPGTPACVSVS
jgi:hypothetical protein